MHPCTSMGLWVQCCGHGRAHPGKLQKDVSRKGREDSRCGTAIFSDSEGGEALLQTNPVLNVAT